MREASSAAAEGCRLALGLQWLWASVAAAVHGNRGTQALQQKATRRALDYPQMPIASLNLSPAQAPERLLCRGSRMKEVVRGERLHRRPRGFEEFVLSSARSRQRRRPSKSCRCFKVDDANC